MRRLICFIMALVLSVSAVAQTEPTTTLRHTLNALLTEAGLLAEADDRSRKMLSDLAHQAGELAQQTDDSPKQLEARIIQARAYNALAQDAIQQNKPTLARLRMNQMRRAAEEARSSKVPGAGAGGWVLMVDLIEGNRSARTLRERQASAMAQLGRFITMHADDPVAADASMMLAVKLALLRLYDQAGDNQRALSLLTELEKTLESDDPRADDFANIRANAAFVGKPLDPRLSKNIKRNSWMFLILSNEATQPTPADLADIKVTVKDQRDAALMLYQVSADDEPLPQHLGRALPRYLLVDRQGIIQAVGHTPAVLDRLEELLLPSEPATPIERIEIQEP